MITFVFLVGGGLLLYFGAEWLVRGSSNLALRYGVPPLVVGLTVVAFGTSAPEMVVSVKAALGGLGSIALGNVVGSNIFNVAVILGLSAMLRPLRVNVQVLKVDTPLMVLASLLFMLMMGNGVLDRWEAGILFAGILVYVALTLYLGKKSSREMPAEELGSLMKSPSGTGLRDGIFIVVGLAGLVAGASFFVKGAISLAEALGVSEAVIALTIVAMGTSLPELATSVVASIKKQEDIAVGNIIGSNIFNLMAILGVSGLVSPLHAQGIGLIDLLFMTGLSVLLLPLMRSRFQIGRLEGGFFLLVYAAYMLWLWP